jgi:26S proteasome regulatory subunit N1
MNGSAIAGILTVLHACLTLKTTIHDKYHYILYFLTTAMNPRVLATVDADLKLITTNVRVGMAVETVGQAGRPKVILTPKFNPKISFFYPKDYPRKIK